MFMADDMKNLGTHGSAYYPCLPVPYMQPAGLQAMDAWGQVAMCCVPQQLGQGPIAEMPSTQQGMPFAQECMRQMVLVEIPVVMVHPDTQPLVHEQACVQNYLPSVPLSIRGNVWRFARDHMGTRSVQQAFDEATCDDDRVVLAAELRSHVWEALKCSNANHVIQKCISTMRPVDSQWIIDELLQSGVGAASRAAKHRYGCRILQRLFEHCSPEQMRTIAEDLLLDAVPLCSHIFAKYVMQHLLEFGTADHISRLTWTLTEHARSLGSDGSGCAVINKALENASGVSQVSLVNALLEEEGLVADMACSRHGHLAAKLALQLADLPHKLSAVSALAAQEEKLKSSRYGRVLMGFVQKSMISIQN